MKLSFSIPSKSTPKPRLLPHSEGPNKPEEDGKEYVTEFEPSKTLSDRGLNRNRNRNIVIPPIENEWRPSKRMKNLELPLQSDADTHVRFEVESLSSSADPAADKMSYGLNLRSKEDDGNETQKLGTEDVLLEKLRYDLKRLSEDPGFEQFEDVPVEGFGAALLAGYGWREGRGIGKNAKEDVEVKQYEKRTAKEGLGFVSYDTKTPPPPIKDKDVGKDKQKEKHRDRNGAGDGFFTGKDVRVIAGSRDIVGSKGSIVERLNRDWVVLKLAKTGDRIEVRVSDIAYLGSKEEEKCLKKLKDLEIREAKKSNNGNDEKHIVERSKNSRDSVKRGSGEVKIDKQSRVPWLRSHIRVRIISKDFKRGRLYLKKGKVVDVVGPYTCDVSMDESQELVQGVDQNLLETALPRRGGPVLVLYGKHKGVYGNLVQRDLDQEVGVVQDSDTHELLDVKLEQIAEYTGDPSYMGY